MRTSLWLIILLWGCSKQQMDDCITSAGERTHVWREVAEFQALRCTDRLTVHLYQDSSQGPLVRIEGPRNLLGQIQTEVVDGELRIDNHMTCNFVRKIEQDLRIYVNAMHLNRIFVESAADIRTEDTLHLDRLNVRHEGQSDVYLTLDCREVFVKSFNAAHTRLSGKADQLKGSIEDASDMDARNLEAREVLVDVHTPLDTYVDGTELIFVRIYNKGNIYYRREPTGLKELNVREGSGQLLRMP